MCGLIRKRIDREVRSLQIFFCVMGGSQLVTMGVWCLSVDVRRCNCPSTMSTMSTSRRDFTLGIEATIGVTQRRVSKDGDESKSDSDIGLLFC